MWISGNEIGKLLFFGGGAAAVAGWFTERSNIFETVWEEVSGDPRNRL